MDSFPILKNGFIILDKPRGPSSHEITAYLKKLMKLKRCGNAGTLDPQVSGVMIIGINKATRLLQYVVGKEKTYVGVMKTKNFPNNLQEVQKEFDKFVGLISQTPPKQSAVAKRKRKRQIFYFNALELEGRHILFEAKVEAGTYIRNLCIDAGKAFGGGRMVELRRTAVGKFGEEQCVRLPRLADAVWECKNNGSSRSADSLIKPCEDILMLTRVYIKNSAEEKVCRGAPLAFPGVASFEANFKKGENLALFGTEGKLIGVASAALDSSEIGDGKTIAHPRTMIKSI